MRLHVAPTQTRWFLMRREIRRKYEYTVFNFSYSGMGFFSDVKSIVFAIKITQNNKSVYSLTSDDSLLCWLEMMLLVIQLVLLVIY